MKYKILEFGTTELLAKAVNDEIGKGWIPIGGVAVCVIQSTDERRNQYRADYYYSQAMILEDKAGNLQ